MSAPLPSAGEDGKATRWTISGGWRDGDKQFTGVRLDPAAPLPEVAVQWIDDEGPPVLLVAAWDYELAMRTHAQLWRERLDAERPPPAPRPPSAPRGRGGRRFW